MLGGHGHSLEGKAGIVQSGTGGRPVLRGGSWVRVGSSCGTWAAWMSAHALNAISNYCCKYYLLYFAQPDRLHTWQYVVLQYFTIVSRAKHDSKPHSALSVL